MIDCSICKTPGVGKGRVLTLSPLQHLWSERQPTVLAPKCGCLLTHEPELAPGTVIHEPSLAQNVASHDPVQPSRAPQGLLALCSLLCMVEAPAITGKALRMDALWPSYPVRRQQW